MPITKEEWNMVPECKSIKLIQNEIIKFFENNKTKAYNCSELSYELKINSDRIREVIRRMRRLNLLVWKKEKYTFYYQLRENFDMPKKDFEDKGV